MERRSDYEAKLALSGSGTPLDIQLLDPELMAEAERRREIVLTLEQGDRFDDATVSAAAKEFGCSKRQFNRYRQRYRDSDELTALLSQGRAGGRGKSRLPDELEEIIQQVLEEYDRNFPQALDIQIIGEIERRCDEAAVNCCSRRTLRARIGKIPSRERTARRYGRKIASERHEHHKGQTPKLDFPLERIQIDHTLVDVVCTGTHDRGHVGRLWITLAIDEATRAILAFVLSWEYPNASTVAQCLYRVMIPKDEWLKRVGTERVWPMFGKPDRVYLDNASEFSSRALRFGCNQYNIGLEHRPKGLPHFGGIIERVVGTVMTEMRLLSAATAKRRGFSKVKTISPNEKAEMSREELEAWLIEFICGKYHNRPHSSTRQNPQLAWLRGIYGTERRAGRGAPAVPKDKQKIYLDFADIETRTIERYGIRWDNILYWGEVLRPFLDAGDQRRHIVRRNPYDASRIYFRHPDDGLYYELRSSDITLPSVPVWEYQQAHKREKEEFGDRPDTETTMASIKRQREIEEQARNRTQQHKRRKNQERRRQAAEVVDEVTPHSSSEDEQDLASPPTAGSPRRDVIYEVYE